MANIKLMASAKIHFSLFSPSLGQTYMSAAEWLIFSLDMLSKLDASHPASFTKHAIRNINIVWKVIIWGIWITQDHGMSAQPPVWSMFFSVSLEFKSGSVAVDYRQNYGANYFSLIILSNTN